MPTSSGCCEARGGGAEGGEVEGGEEGGGEDDEAVAVESFACSGVGGGGYAWVWGFGD